MFDIGWSEILVIAIVLVVVVGPKDLPRMLRAFGKATSKLRAQAGEFRRNFDEALREADLGDVKDLIDEARSLDPRSDIRKALSPLQSAGDEIKASLRDATSKITEATTSDPFPTPALDPADTSPAEAETPATDRPAPRKRSTAKKAASSGTASKSSSANGSKPATGRTAAKGAGAAKTSGTTRTAAKAGASKGTPKAAAASKAASAPKAAVAPKSAAKASGARKTTKPKTTARTTKGATDTGSDA